MRELRRSLREALDFVWLFATSLGSRPRSHPSLKLMPLPAPDRPPSDPLRERARELLQAFDDYLAGARQAYTRRTGTHGALMYFGVPLALARRAYREAAMESGDPFHEQVAMLFERSFWDHGISYATDDPARSILSNWLREPPHIETSSAEDWIEQTAEVVRFTKAVPVSGYTVTLSLEAKQTLPRPAVLCLDVGADVSIASASLLLQREAPAEKTDLIWKRSQIWVTVDDPRLEEGDRIDVTVTTGKPIVRSTQVRIGLADSRALARPSLPPAGG